jgi:hypothetical protein
VSGAGAPGAATATAGKQKATRAVVVLGGLYMPHAHVRVICYMPLQALHTANRQDTNIHMAAALSYCPPRDLAGVQAPVDTEHQAGCSIGTHTHISTPGNAHRPAIMHVNELMLVLVVAATGLCVLRTAVCEGSSSSLPQLYAKQN